MASPSPRVSLTSARRAAVLKHSPRFGFPSSAREPPGSKSDVPGPGHVAVAAPDADSRHPSSPKFSLGGRTAFGAAIGGLGDTTPGPGQYAPSHKLTQRSTQVGCATVTSDRISPCPPGSYATPGPGAYGPGRRASGPSFSISGRRPEGSSGGATSVGPGAYNTGSGFGHQAEGLRKSSNGFTMGARWPLRAGSEVRLALARCLSPPRPSTAMTTPLPLLSRLRLTQTPGPGAYGPSVRESLRSSRGGGR
jgi:hypothetical protein